jgi:hypothetical protein
MSFEAFLGFHFFKAHFNDSITLQLKILKAWAYS